MVSLGIFNIPLMFMAGKANLVVRPAAQGRLTEWCNLGDLLFGVVSVKVNLKRALPMIFSGLSATNESSVHGI